MTTLSERSFGQKSSPPGGPTLYNMKTVDVRNREDWRRWLAENHAKETEIWLVFHKKGTASRMQATAYSLA